MVYIKPISYLSDSFSKEAELKRLKVAPLTLATKDKL